jgi:hypothetical protein
VGVGVERIPHCSACLAPIRWETSEGDRRIPLDPDPDPAGTVVLVPGKRGGIRARVLNGGQLPAQETAYVPHWVTCPQGKDFKRRRHAAAPKCKACGMPMDADLAKAEEWIYHPCCELTPRIPGPVAQSMIDEKIRRISHANR